ncbi:MAG: D-alanine--D-alanine ligase [Armatimonadota bacterium]|jgi:D-alanine-D-alanine ligase
MTELTAEQVGRVGVLMGGDSREREISLRSGAGIMQALQERGFDAVSIDPDTDLITQLRSENVQVAFNILHGGRGEDGTIPGVLEMAGIPYTGSGVLASALTMNKTQTKRVLQASDVRTPAFYAVDPQEKVGKQCRFAANFLRLPAVCKPADEGSSIGVSIVKHIEELEGAVGALLEKYGSALIEKFIAGPEVTVGVLGTGENVRALPVLELRPRREFYDYEAKYTEGMTEFVLPAQLDEPVYVMTQQAAIRAHKVLGCHGWSRVDMHVDKEGVPQIHEVNSVPGMTPLSDIPAEAEAEGTTYQQVVLEILQSAFDRPGPAQQQAVSPSPETQP